MKFIDTHCHIHDREFYPEDREAVYARAVEAGVDMLVVGTSEADSRAAAEFAAHHERAWAIVGVHPHDSKAGWHDIKTLLSERPEKVVGVGEIGLDYHYDNSPRDVQLRALEEQLQWAVDHHLPVSFHVRDAFADFWPVFDSFQGVRGVLHSYTDTLSTLEQALSRGLLIGVNGISTFTKDLQQQEMFDAIPLDRLILETDAPFLTPAPLRGTVNEPAFVRNVAEYHANRRRIELEHLARATSANARALFAL